MKHWVITGTIDPMKLRGVVSGRSGGSAMFVAYSRFLQQWYWVWGGGHEKEIPDPEMLFLEEEWVRENRNLGYKPAQRSSSTRIRKKKCAQLEFSL